MHLRLRVLSFTVASLLLSLNSPRPVSGTPLNVEVFNAVSANTQVQEDLEAELQRLINLGETYNSLGKYEKAVESANASLTLARQLENPQAQANAFVTLASAYQSLAPDGSEYRKATQAAISGLTTSWKINNHDSEAKALAVLGSIYNSRSENKVALIFARQGLKVAQENNVPTAAASSLMTLAGLHLQERQYENAIAAAQKASDVLRSLEQREAEAAAAVMQGLAYLGQGNVQQSLKFAELGLDISREVKSSRIEALALIVLSLGNSRNGNPQQAIELIDRSRSIAKDLRNPDLEEVALEVLGEIYKQAGQKEKAIAAYQKAISISNSFSAIAGVARIYQESNLLATAIAYYKQAVNRNEQQIPRKIPGLPVWLQESFPQAIQDVNGLAATNVYRSFSNLLLAQTRPIEAQQVVELLKGQELREYTGNPRVNITPTGQPASLAITPTEQQILREYGSLINFGYRIDECQQTRCSELEQLLQQREDLTQQYYQSLVKLETDIKTKRASDEAFVDPNQFAQKAQAIVEAQPGTLLVYPLVLDDKIWLLWASKGGILNSVEVTNVNQTELATTVAKFRKLLQNRLSNVDELKATSKQLYDWLLKPLERELKANDIHNLVFALDRSTRYIPLAALFDGNQYLIENYTVSTVLSANLTDTQPQVVEDRRVASLPSGFKANMVENQDPTVLAMGVSDAVGGFRPLPNVPPELDAIVRQDSGERLGIFPGQEFLDKAFTFFTLRDNVPDHQLLHIATHSKFVPGRANQSFLLLGTGERLAIPDIENWLNLRNINLVVLSACETALGGPGLDGREIAGVGYYFLKGGAKTVVASLWNVDDYSTRLLMEQFYKNLAKGTPKSPVTKAEAMRDAQLMLLKGDGDESPNAIQRDRRIDPPPPTSKTSLRHPFYWAPFILMGRGL
jgi:CHAT domain-containing protein/tetratricopeptide (TPR) repeat protein